MKPEKTFKKLIMLGIAFCCLAAVISIPINSFGLNSIKLSGEGQKAIAVLVFALILWISETLPFHITGFLSIILLAVFKVDDFKTLVKDGMGNETTLFFLGVLILAVFIGKSGLGKRVSAIVLSWTGNKTKYIILGFLVMGAFIGMWLTTLAGAAILMPLAKGVLEEEDIKPSSNFGKALMVATAWGPLCGGVGTPAGCGSNTITIALLKSIANYDLTFIQWMKYGLPIMILMIIPAWLLLLKVFKPEIKTLGRTKDELKKERKELGGFTREQKVIAFMFVFTAALWLLTPLLQNISGISIPTSLPVILSVSVLFIPGTTKLKWKDISAGVSWESILLLATGMSIGMALYSSGAAEWLATMLLGGIGSSNPLLQILMLVLFTSLLKVTFSSNTVTATIITPIVISYAVSLGQNPLAITLPVAISASLAFILVTSSPTNVIAYSAGYFSIKDYARGGIFQTLASSIIISLVVYGIGTVSGLY